MLEAHLDEASDGATRRKDFVRQSAAWIASQLPPQQYPQLLDLGCGPGIYAELFARQGYQVSGIDFSVRSLDYAKQSAAEKGLAIQYRQGDYTQIEFSGPFHLITLIYCDFGVLTPSARTALLKQIYASLLPGGAFLFDVFTPLNYKDKPESRRWFVEEQGYWSESRPWSCMRFTGMIRTLRIVINMSRSNPARTRSITSGNMDLPPRN